MASIEPAGPGDLAATGQLHADHLDAGLFPRLGPGFLRRYHATFVDSPHGVALVARDDGEVVGFLCGTTANRAHYRWVVNNESFALAWRGGLGLLLRPRLAWEFLTTRALRYLRGIRARRAAMTTADPTATSGSVAVLTHVACAEQARGNGLGRRLVAAFLAQARSAGASEARLITKVHAPTCAFYERLGWTPVRDRQARDGTTVREYRMPLVEVQRA